jgi:surface-anchored protein
MVWQATGPGHYNIRINTRDGIGASDFFSPLIGAHEHFNWGFSTTGIYCATFQIIGQRIGELTNISSMESTFVFHVQPLPPPTNYATWAKGHWPPGFNPPTALTNGNPDGDLLNNLLEYAFAANPTNPAPATALPCFSFVTTNGDKYGALSFTRYMVALDLEYCVEATSILSNDWLPLTNVFSAVPDITGLTEFLTIRDALPATNVQRFHRLRVKLR